MERARLRAFAAIALFTVLWIFVVVPRLIESDSFQSQAPPVQYLLYNLGFLVLFLGLGMVFLGSLIVGLIGFLDFSLILDNWQPPFAYNPQGELVITSPDTLAGASVDRVLGWVATDLLHLGGPPVYAFVYVVVPLLVIGLTIFVVRHRRRVRA